MRVAVVGAGLAGLATAAAFSRSGHQVSVFGQAGGLRASGLARSRRRSAASRTVPPALAARMMALSGGAVLRRLTRPRIESGQA